MRSSKPILYSKNPSSETSDDDKANIFVSELNAISREPVFMSKNFWSLILLKISPQM
jgi:hypothetical protein